MKTMMTMKKMIGMYLEGDNRIPQAEKGKYVD